MIRDLSVNFENEGLQYFIKVPTESTNLPYNLAEVFKEVIEKSNANSEIVLEQLTEYFGYSKTTIKLDQ